MSILTEAQAKATPIAEIEVVGEDRRLTQISEFDRVYYLTSEQERKRKELQKLKLKIKDEMYVIMRQFQHADEEQEVVSS